MLGEPRTEAGKRLLDLSRAAVLDPAIHKLLSPGGKPELVALMSLQLLENEVLAIEAEAAAINPDPWASTGDGLTPNERLSLAHKTGIEVGRKEAAINPEWLARALEPEYRERGAGDPDAPTAQMLARNTAERVKERYDRIAKEGTPT